MAILGFFSKKSKAKLSNSSQASTSSAVQDDGGSAEGYVFSPPSVTVPTMVNGDDGYTSSNASFVSAASSKKVRLRFSKKALAATSSPLALPHELPPGAHNASTDKLSHTIDTSLNSLPSRTSVFPSFHGSNSSPALARPSAVEGPVPRSQPAQFQTEDLPENSKSRGGLLNWRDRKKSKPDIGSFLPPLDGESFNLKSFRHVLPEPPSDSTRSTSPAQYSPQSLVPPARPRGSSMASTDSSQRISVAAFREAQARRSSTNLTNGGSPSPIIRPVSVTDSLRSASDIAPSRPSRNQHPPQKASASPTLARNVKSTPSRPSAQASSSSDASEEEDSDSDDCSPSRARSSLDRQTTITKRSYQTKSDLGHGAIRSGQSHHRQSTLTRSELGHELTTNMVQPSPSRGPPPSSFQKTEEASVGTRSFSLYRRQRASHSTSELNPSASAQRASVLVEANKRGTLASQRQSISSSDTSDSDSNSDSSDDNAPLSALRKHGGPNGILSRINGASTPTRAARKPLIDLRLTSNPITGKPVQDRSASEKLSLISPTNISGRLSRLTAAAGLGEHAGASASKSEANLSKMTNPKPPYFQDLPKPDSPVSSGTISPPLRTTSPETITPNSRRLSLSPSVSSPESAQNPKQAQIDDHGVRSILASESEAKPPSVAIPNPSPALNSSKSQTLSFVPSTTTPSHTRPGPPKTITPGVRTSSLLYSASSSMSTQSSSPVQTNDLRPIPIRDRRDRNHGFRVVSRPQKSETSPPLLPSTTNDSHKQIRQQPPQSTNFRQSPSSSFGTPSRPQSIMPALNTKPHLAPLQADSASSASTSSASASGKSSSSRAALSSQSPPQRSLVFSGKRQDSPASSTGGSSNGKAPLTPMDGSDCFSPDVRGSGDSPSGSSAGAVPPSALKGGRGHLKRASVSFQEPIDFDREETVRGRRSSSGLTKPEEQVSVEERENRRRDRRRSEAKAAIELGNVINGPGPISNDEDDEDAAILPSMVSRVHPMNPGAGMNINFNNLPMGWQQQSVPSPMSGMGNPAGVNVSINPQQFMMPPVPGTEQAFYVAHQQAMLIAKQAYQYAVAQQAMAAAADEWERGSNVSAFPAPGGMNMNMGMGGYGMGGMHGMNGMWVSPSSVYTPGPRSMYAGSSVGGAMSEAGWGRR
ncbi:hypothetical protein EW145_g2089 [Phellinidium pouzarii]|uniref:Uncharacterized protein n=1 Tax=Phellinidium pouzarii TaxID=167371 RepID=A0A4S4LC46_9AGAM|nr:hypothetical protein EW145_g2089 [Phellinidium pouzarii]